MHASVTVHHWKAMVSVCELTINSNLRLATFFCHNIPDALTPPICQIIPLPTAEEIILLLKHGENNNDDDNNNKTTLLNFRGH